MFVLFSRTEWQRLCNLGIHLCDEGDGVGDDLIPLRMLPGALATRLPVSQTFIAPARSKITIFGVLN